MKPGKCSGGRPRSRPNEAACQQQSNTYSLEQTVESYETRIEVVVTRRRSLRRTASAPQLDD
jgi:hypothetical protein